MKMFWKVGVPVKVGPAEKTTFPVPVSSVSHDAKVAPFVKKVEVAIVSALFKITSDACPPERPVRSVM